MWPCEAAEFSPLGCSYHKAYYDLGRQTTCLWTVPTLVSSAPFPEYVPFDRSPRPAIDAVISAGLFVITLVPPPPIPVLSFSHLSSPDPDYCHPARCFLFCWVDPNIFCVAFLHSMLAFSPILLGIVAVKINTCSFSFAFCPAFPPFKGFSHYPSESAIILCHGPRRGFPK